MSDIHPWVKGLSVTVPFEYGDIVKAMLDPTTGVKVQDRTYRLKNYPQCFICSEMVDWILHYFKFKDEKTLTRDEAVVYADKMRGARIFGHVIDSHKFSDQYLFFRFQVSLQSVFETISTISITEPVKEVPVASTHNFSVLDIDLKPVDLSIYRGKNYTELVALYEKYKEQDFVVLGFPCNQFGAQEPGTNEQIKEFVKQYNVTFPLFDKVEVNGDGADPLWKYLTNSITETMLMIPYNRILWNFAKFLVDRNGVCVKRFGSKTNPLSFEEDIVAQLKSTL